MADYYPRLSSIQTGMRCTCPRCGQGQLYDGILTVRDACEVCGFEYAALNTDDGPAFFIIVFWSAVVLTLAAWFQFSVEPPVWLHFVIWIPIIVVGAVLLMRPFKAWLIAQAYKHNVTDADTTR